MQIYTKVNQNQPEPTNMPLEKAYSNAMDKQEPHIINAL